MTSLLSPAPAVKPNRSKPARFARILATFPNGTRLVEIEERGPRSLLKLTHYYVSPLPAEFGKAFRWAKFAHQGGEVRDVNIGDGAEHPASCECLGHERWSHRTVCRHIACTRKLLDEGKL